MPHALFGKPVRNGSPRFAAPCQLILAPIILLALTCARNAQQPFQQCIASANELVLVSLIRYSSSVRPKIHLGSAEVLESARKRLLDTAIARQAEAEVDKREQWAAVTAPGQALGGSALTIDPEQLNTPTARAARLIANVSNTLVVRINATTLSLLPECLCISTLAVALPRLF